MRKLKPFVVALAAALPAMPWVEQQAVVNGIEARVASYRTEISNTVENGVQVCMVGPAGTVGFRVRAVLNLMDGRTQEYGSKARWTDAGWCAKVSTGGVAPVGVKKLTVVRTVEEQATTLIEQ